MEKTSILEKHEEANNEKGDYLKYDPVPPYPDLPGYEYAVPQFFDDRHLSWNFVYTERAFRYGSLIFVSKDDFEKYDAFRKKLENPESNDLKLKLQSEGKAMPLFQVYGTVGLGFLGNYITVYKSIIPPRGREFDKKIDRYQYCEVKFHWHRVYERYVFKFTPDPTDSSKNFEITLIYHKRQSIADFALNGIRYRWLRQLRLQFFKNDWKYTLQKIPAGELSMVDKFDNSNKPVLDSVFQDSILKTLLPAKFRTSSQFLTHDIVGEAADCRNYDIVWNGISTRFSYLSNKPRQQLQGSILEVPDEALVFLCISSVLKKIERDLENAQRS